ncbi:hypothetical protein LYNGBM3L_32050 [Moorena producens 3L]|uniref:Uncharacterized protein n=1 Tax=Moorena producens 3L TaxID=489825 RepID=F4XU84_9CYAN|nr:hypothetical protein LYNGBM3L_32050 [Moorena producens 3L]
MGVSRPVAHGADTLIKALAPQWLRCIAHKQQPQFA